MAKESAKKRNTFRHGNLPAALIVAALGRLKVEDAESLSLRELARDAGVNHRAVYRHFPDKLSLLAHVAREGWRRLTKEMSREAGRQRGEEALVAYALGFFRFARKHPNLFHLMAGPRINLRGSFPEFEAAVADAMRIFARGFIEAGVRPELSRGRALLFVAALTGVVEQILHRRVRVSPAKMQGFVADAAKRLVKGLR
jgi:AcrR family transcriptional regulator